MMSGDQGIDDSKIVFYPVEMTEAKKIVLKSRGIKLAYLDNKNKNDDSEQIADWESFCKYEGEPG